MKAKQKQNDADDMNNIVFKIPAGRLSYFHGFEPTAFEDGDGEGGGAKKFKTSVIMDKEDHADTIRELKSIMRKMAIAKWGKVPANCKMCLRDGEEKEDKDGYGEDVMFLSCSDKKRPVLLDRDGSAVTEEDDILYSGCYAHVSIRLWVQDNKYGKRINAAWRAAKFVRDGEPFSGDQVDADEEFADMEEDEDSVL